MAVTVRRAGEEDAELISSLNAEVQALHAVALPEWFKPPDESTFPPSVVRRLIREDDNIILIAAVDGQDAGYAYAQIVRHPETAWRYAHELVYVHQIGVHAAYRRQGVGGALLSTLESEADARGIRTVALDHWSFNEGARAFFSARGFALYNERLWKRLAVR